MLLAMAIVYTIPILVVIASLFVTSRDARRKILYLCTVVTASIITLLIAWNLWPGSWGFWLIAVLPTTLVTVIRLIVSGALSRSHAPSAGHQR